jgi:hypothetical protein
MRQPRWIAQRRNVLGCAGWMLCYGLGNETCKRPVKRSYVKAACVMARILIVDDEPNLRHTAGYNLQREGH